MTPSLPPLVDLDPNFHLNWRFCLYYFFIWFSVSLLWVACRGGRSHIFRTRLRCCSKILESGSGSKNFLIWESESCSNSGYCLGTCKKTSPS